MMEEKLQSKRLFTISFLMIHISTSTAPAEVSEMTVQYFFSNRLALEKREYSKNGSDDSNSPLLSMDRKCSLNGSSSSGRASSFKMASKAHTKMPAIRYTSP